jgi:predicted ATPase
MVLLTGPAGAGKSRLGHELVRRLAARGAPAAIWLGAADPLSSGAAFGLLGQVLRRAFGLADGEPEAGAPGDARRGRIRAWAARHPAGVAPAAEILGELALAALEGEDGGEPGAGRQEGTPVTELVRQAFLSFLRAECAVRPVVLVLDDLHWGDLSTIRLIDAAVGALSDQRLLVLGLARAGIQELFPQRATERSIQEIRVRKLSRRASEQLVRQVLGPEVSDEALRDLVERSEGHASQLVEMIEAVAGGKGTATPPAVLAMIQARLEKLDPAARRVLRAASIFGETFWRGGVEALLGGGGGGGSGDAAAWLAELVEQDLIALGEGARFPNELEYRFRRPLVREAAYEMLTEGDRVAGHWLAGHWLEQAGETDPEVLRDHFERCGRGGGPEQAPEAK